MPPPLPKPCSGSRGMISLSEMWLFVIVGEALLTQAIPAPAAAKEALSTIVFNSMKLLVIAGLEASIYKMPPPRLETWLLLIWLFVIGRAECRAPKLQ